MKTKCNLGESAPWLGVTGSWKFQGDIGAKALARALAKALAKTLAKALAQVLAKAAAFPPPRFPPFNVHPALFSTRKHIFSVFF